MSLILGADANSHSLVFSRVANFDPSRALRVSQMGIPDYEPKACAAQNLAP